MAAPFSVCTKEEQRSVIRFFLVGRCIRGRNPSKTFNTIQEQCIALMECLRMDWKIKKWSHKCYAWQRSQMTIYGQHWGQYWVFTWHGSVRWVTIDGVAHVLQISHSSAYKMMHNKLGFHKVCARWVPNNSQGCIKKCAWTSAKTFGSLW